MLSILFKRITSTFKYLFGDIIKIIKYKDKFILNELTERAIQNKNKVAITYLGLPFLKLYSFIVFTDPSRDTVEAISTLGQYNKENPDHYDPKARIIFDPIKKLLGREFIINLNGPEVSDERHHLLKYFKPNKAREKASVIFTEVVDTWSKAVSLNQSISYACMRIIATTFLGINKIPSANKLQPLIKKAQQYLLDTENVPVKEIDIVIAKLKKLNDKTIAKNEKSLLENESYLQHMIELKKAEKFSDISALGILLVEGNITSLLTSTIVHIASDKALQNKIRTELKELRSKNLEFKKSQYLNKVYEESIRCFAPVSPLVRYASKASCINGIAIPARSFIFLPTRRMLHDPTVWKNPKKFDISHQDNPLYKPTSLAFSNGPRACPASFGFTYNVFMTALECFFLDNELTLTGHQVLEEIALDAKDPCLNQTYYADIQKVEESSLSKSPITSVYDIKQKSPNPTKINPSKNPELKKISLN